MASLDDVRAIATGFPGVTEARSRQREGVGWRAAKGLFVWERGPSNADLTTLAGLGRSWPDGVVVGIRTAGLQEKDALIETFPDAFFTIPHFDGYAAVLTRLDGIEHDLLRETITDAWMLRTTTTLRNAWLAEHPPAAS